MLTRCAPPTTYSKPKQHKDTSLSSAINRLLLAALVNENFRHLLLTEPACALAQGYQGEIFPLDDNERILLLSIQADNLRDFASQIISCQEGRLQSRSGEWIPAEPKSKSLVLEAE
jgi:hypothetical protein